MKQDHINLQRRMRQAVDDLWGTSDRLVYALEKEAETRRLTEDEEAALIDARRWRSLTETDDA